MQFVIPGPGNGLALLILSIIKGRFVIGQDSASSRAVKRHAEACVFKSTRVATVSIPDRRRLAEMKRGATGVRRFLVILKVKAATAAGYRFRQPDFESPPNQVQGVDTIIGQFAAAPVPMPVPVV